VKMQLRLRVLLIVVVFGWMLASGPAKSACAQDSPKGAGQEQASSQEKHKHPTSIEGELGKETREAAGEEKDETEQFKRSSSVTWVARVTGLSLEHAYWLCIGFNFAIIAAVLTWALRAKAAPAFRARTLTLQKAMQEASKASQEANRRLREVESRLSKIGSEIEAMRTAAEQEAAAEEIRMKAAAEEETKKIVETAELEIVAATKAARRELKAYAADLAVSLAEKQIFVDTSTDQALIRSFADRLSSVNDAGAGLAGKDGN